MANFLDNLRARFSPASTAPVAPVAVSTVIQADNSAEVKFGFNQYGQAQYDPAQTYAAFAKQQAAVAGISLQANYTAQYIVNGTPFVVDSSLTFAELNAKYSVTAQTPVSVSIPDPERPAGENG